MNGDRQPFSVSMCVYGGDDPEHFREAVKSVLDQTVLPDEVVLTVDGPVPEPMKQAVVWAEQACKTLRVVRLPENRGTRRRQKRRGLPSADTRWWRLWTRTICASPTGSKNSWRIYKTTRKPLWWAG